MNTNVWIDLPTKPGFWWVLHPDKYGGAEMVEVLAEGESPLTWKVVWRNKFRSSGIYSLRGLGWRWKEVEVA